MQPMIWDDKARNLKLLDQRILPHRILYHHCHNADDVARAIASMVVRGAPAIGICAAFGLALEALSAIARPGIAEENFWSEMRSAYHRLSESRPTAVNLEWALRRIWSIKDRASSPSLIADLWLEEAKSIMHADIAVNKKIGGFGAALVNDGATVLTHCNAGALATGGWGTALGVFRSAYHEGKKFAVFACETRPYLQGARLTAFELQRGGMEVILITDSCAATVMAEGKIDLIITGADRIAANGDTANKIGTYALAILAHYHHIPFYIAAPVSTIDFNLDEGSRIQIEKRDPREVTHFADKLIAPEGVTAYNPSFDVTPGTLIDGFITERGIFKYDEIIELNRST
ncbi:MAG: S-methyl-5-thioribose-1-phosphate isomerase [Firmicutes bacterium]|nr:S-methyl-5-thioribose-1-phosphate isomerase [Bacillota bacterium]